MTELTPREIVRELDRYIIGQEDAKRAVAVALRNRYRRAQLDEAIREEVTPKNILMIGPTGVGKTEIARRLARLTDAPFVKVEATKFTEVGYVGRDVESIIRDLVEAAIRLVKNQHSANVRSRAECVVEDRLVDLLCAMRESKIEPKRMVLVSGDSRCAPGIVLVEGKRGAAPSLILPRALMLRDDGGEMSREMRVIYETGNWYE